MIPVSNRNKSFGRSLSYVFQEKSVGEDMATAPVIVASNMAGRNPDELTTEFEVVQRMNQKTTTPAWSVSLSLHPDEPTKQPLEWQMIVEQFIHKVGMMGTGEEEAGVSPERNQFVALLHQDRPHAHVHLIVNRVNVAGEICY